jgi:tRNA A-37 threonylcarbamoyl transferase component Bud32
VTSITDLRPGEVFAEKFVVVKRLASGGMGSVYVVEHRVTGRRHALKLMLPELVTSAEQRERFLREARVGALLDDFEHIVEVLDAGVESTTSTPYLLMELLEGRDLATYLDERGALPLGEALPILSQVADALSLAHSKGVVHRDLKPENLFLVQKPGKSPVVKVLDFGIAKIMEGTKATGTLQGGTVSYMAPEQAQRKAQVGPRTDLMAYGLIAYRMLAGRSYWLGEDMKELYGELFAPVYESASERAAEQEVPLPAGFDAFFARTVTPRAADRVATAREAYALLEAACAASAAHEGPAQSEPVSAVGPVASLGAAATKVGAEASPSDPSRPADRTALAGGEHTELSAEPPDPLPMVAARSKLPLAVAGLALVAGLGWWAATPRGASPAPPTSAAAQQAPATLTGGATRASAFECGGGIPDVARGKCVCEVGNVEVTTEATSRCVVGEAVASSSIGLDQYAARRPGLEAKVRSGKASVREIRELIGICRHFGDRACVSMASAALQKQSNPTEPLQKQSNLDRRPEDIF